ncbi:MAG: winged helix-turn-helix domain-containing protein, partial [Candidatus Limnocylindrus sp.]
KADYNVLEARNGEEALVAIRAHKPDLVFLDVMMPKLNGFQVTQQVRADAALDCVKIILLTAKGQECDREVGKTVGADDYMTKPFRVRELLSRVKSQLRRAYGDLADALGGRIIRADELLIDLERRRVSRAGKKITLTPTEFEILRLLAEKPGRVFSRRDLLERVRDYDAAISGDEKTINVHVSHLRDKIEVDPSNPRFVSTVRGVGYAFADRSDRGERSGS